MDQNFHVSRELLAHAYFLAGKTSEAAAEIEILARSAPDLPYVLGAVGYFYGIKGRAEEARAVLAKLDTL